MNSQLYDEDVKRARNRKRIEEAKRQKRKQQKRRKIIRKIGPIIGIVFIVVLIMVIGKSCGKREKPIEPEEATEQITQIENEIQTVVEQSEVVNETEEKLQNTTDEKKTYAAYTNELTQSLGEDVFSTYAILIDTKEATILAQRDAKSKINPASMTKILTLLVAAEAAPNLDDKVTITRDIIDYSYANDCSNVGFEENEVVSVRDLMYGTILPSGADAAAALAIYTSGSLEAFVDKMNEKLTELGLSETANFTNCVGLYDANHYCSSYDMAMIMQATMENELCKEVLKAKTYKTSKTTQHPDGILISNWFLRRIEDKDSGGEVLGGKTGYVVQSGNCAVSYAEDSLGKEYIAVTANAHSGWRCIYDHVALYKQFLE